MTCKNYKSRTKKGYSSESGNQKGGDQQGYWKKTKCKDCREKQIKNCRHCLEE